jgi:hypothetical protein
MHDFYDFTDLKPGMRINVEGAYTGGRLLASAIAIKQDGDLAELEGCIERADAAHRSVQLLGLTLHLPEGLDIRGYDKQPLQPEALQAGTRIKAKGRLQAGRSFVPEKIKLKPPTPDAHDEIEAEITALDPAHRTLTILGFEVACDEDVEIEA